MTKEAILCALEAFPKNISPNTARKNISLKYLFKGANGSASWIGLRSAQRSADTWKALLSNGSDIVEIGVFADVDSAPTPPVSAPITGKNGKQIHATFYLGSGLRWSSADDPDSMPIPLSYEVRAFETRKMIEAKADVAFCRNASITSWTS